MLLCTAVMPLRAELTVPKRLLFHLSSFGALKLTEGPCYLILRVPKGDPGRWSDLLKVKGRLWTAES